MFELAYDSQESDLFQRTTISCSSSVNSKLFKGWFNLGLQWQKIALCLSLSDCVHTVQRASLQAATFRELLHSETLGKHFKLAQICSLSPL